MEELKAGLEKIFSNNIVQSCLVILLNIFIYEVLNRLFFKRYKKNSKLSNRNKTYVRVLSSIVRYTLIILTIILILQINGVNVDSILASAGIIGIVVGFAVQDALKDIIRGAIMLTDRYFSVGDVVKYGEIMGKVVSTGLNTTKIEDLQTFNIISIANRNIEQIQVVSESLDIMVPLPYELPLEKSEVIVCEITNEVKNINDVKDCKYKGVSNFKESNIDYNLNIHCKPTSRRQVTRDVNGVILKVLEKYKIQIPYNQLDIHQK